MTYRDWIDINKWLSLVGALALSSVGFAASANGQQLEMNAERDANLCERLDPDPAYVEEMLINIGSIGDPNGETFERRVALVVGNSSYEQVAPLKNPVNDANAISDILRAIGFTVYFGEDLDAETLSACMDTYTSDLAADPADLSLFFYAGHGVQLTSEADTEKRNYMLATDARVSEAGEGIGFLQVDRVLARMRSHSQQAVFFYDACRNDPLGDSAPTRIDGTAIKRQAFLSGAAAIELEEADTSDQAGLYIAYATAPNRVADDAFEQDADHSPFTRALLNHIATPGYSIQQAMSYVSNDVGELTNWEQTPWTSSSLTTDLRMNGAITRDELGGEMIRRVNQDLTQRYRSFGEVLSFYLAMLPEGDISAREYRFAVENLASELKGDHYHLGALSADDIPKKIDPLGKRLITQNRLTNRLSLWSIEHGTHLKEFEPGLDIKDVFGFQGSLPFSGDGMRMLLIRMNGTQTVFDLYDRDGALIQPAYLVYADDLVALVVDETSNTVKLTGRQVFSPLQDLSATSSVDLHLNPETFEIEFSVTPQLFQADCQNQFETGDVRSYLKYSFRSPDKRYLYGFVECNTFRTTGTHILVRHELGFIGLGSVIADSETIYSFEASNAEGRLAFARPRIDASRDGQIVWISIPESGVKRWNVVQVNTQTGETFEQHAFSNDFPEWNIMDGFAVMVDKDNDRDQTCFSVLLQSPVRAEKNCLPGILFPSVDQSLKEVWVNTLMAMDDDRSQDAYVITETGMAKSETIGDFYLRRIDSFIYHPGGRHEVFEFNRPRMNWDDIEVCETLSRARAQLDDAAKRLYLRDRIRYWPLDNRCS